MSSLTLPMVYFVRFLPLLKRYLYVISRFKVLYFCPMGWPFGLLNVNAIGLLTPSPLPSEIGKSPVLGIVDSEESAKYTNSKLSKGLLRLLHFK